HRLGHDREASQETDAEAQKAQFFHCGTTLLIMVCRSIREQHLWHKARSAPEGKYPEIKRKPAAYRDAAMPVFCTERRSFRRKLLSTPSIQHGPATFGKRSTQFQGNRAGNNPAIRPPGLTAQSGGS
ncbi:MAG: hypothetical protein KKB63_09525, partial [Alphaproteobacteria bacterium]|nr:hypothetical protein [Alphaproteobacteria bacterium]